MPPLSRSEMEEMAFKAIMGTIGVGHLSCDCPTCLKKSKSASRPTLSDRPATEKELPKSNQKLETAQGHCSHAHHAHHHHHHHAPDLTSTPASQRSSTRQSSRSKASSDSNNPQGRNEKINNLLKAETMSAVFEVFNATVTTDDENKLVTQIQQATKDSKTYPDSKTKIVEICGSKGMDAAAVYGLLAKFRHERNLLTTAILRSNTEREKALLCIKRVDDLMYMLQEAAKRPKDSGSDGIMARLSEIIMEVHDLAKNPSSLYEELLDIKEEHMQLLDDHDDMHQKFMEVNSCHDKLHANHDKLQSTHNKLTNDHTEAKKKAGLVNGLKNDVGRLEKALEKKQDENSELKKELEKFGAEMAKVNALKHEVAQLKKKVTTLSTQTSAEEPQVQVSEKIVPAAQGSISSSAPSAKKKKGKKGTSSTPGADVQVHDAVAKDTKSQETSYMEDELRTLKKSHESMLKELDLLRENLAQIDKLRRAAESSRDKAVERLQLEQATSQNWQEISGGHAEEKAKLEGRLDHSQSLVLTLQSAVNRLEQSLSQITKDLSDQKALTEKFKAEKEAKVQPPVSLSQDTLRLLRKIKVDASQLARDISESTYHQVDLQALINMIQIHVQRVTSEVEKTLDEIIGIKHVEPINAPEAVLPFAYQGQNQQHRIVGNQSYQRFDGSPLSSPHIPSSFTPESTSMLPHRPMIPPGFGESSPSISSVQQQNSMNDVAGARKFTATPSSTSSVFDGSPILSHNLNLNSSHGPIGSRVPSSSLNPSHQANRKQGGGDTITPPPSMRISPYGVGHNTGLGNGAAGVDWSMWSKITK